MSERRRPPVTGPGQEWWTTSRRRIFFDAHTPDWADPHQRGHVPDPDFPLLSGVHPEADMDLLADSGADSVVLFAKCQYGNSYYPTDVGRRHSRLAGRDLFGEQLAAAHRRGLRVIAYFSNMWDVAASGQHPEWALVPLPSRGHTGRWPALCLLSGYREQAHRQVRELAARYPIDGLWSDILTAGPCICHRCDAAFRTTYGRGMPAGPDDDGWLDLVHFSQQILTAYMSEQAAVLHHERPDSAYIPNFYATTYADAVLGLSTEHLALADIGSTEGYTDWHGLAFPGFASSYLRAGIDGRPHEVLVSRFVHTWDFTMRSPAQLRFEAFTVAAHGATVTVDDQPDATGAPDPELYRRLGPVFERIAQRSPWLIGARPEKYAAIWVGQTLRELESLLGTSENAAAGEQSAQFPPSQPRGGPSDLVAAVTGTYRSLVESHVPVDFFDARDECLPELNGYRVLILPDALALSDSQAGAIRDFVSAGGGVVVTGPAGVRDVGGRVVAASPLDDVLGVRFGEDGEFTYPYLRLADPALKAAVGLDRPVPHYGRMATLVPPTASKVEVLAQRTDPVLETDKATFWHNNLPAAGRDTDEPVLIQRSFGAGLVIVSTGRLGNVHARLVHGTYRDLLTALVRRAARTTPDVRIRGSHRNTELVLTRLGDDYVVHLVSGAPVQSLDVHGAFQPAAVEDVAAIPALTLDVPVSVTAASRIVQGKPVSLPIIDGTVVLHRLDDWETVVLYVC